MTKVDWHQFPKERPKKSGKFLVTLSRDTEKDEPIVTTRQYNTKSEKFLPKWCSDIIAWAKLPQPYRQEAKNE